MYLFDIYLNENDSCLFKNHLITYLIIFTQKRVKNGKNENINRYLCYRMVTDYDIFMSLEHSYIIISLYHYYIISYSLLKILILKAFINLFFFCLRIYYFLLITLLTGIDINCGLIV